MNDIWATTTLREQNAFRTIYQIVVGDEDHQRTHTVTISSVSHALDGDDPLVEQAILRDAIEQRRREFHAWREQQAEASQVTNDLLG